MKYLKSYNESIDVKTFKYRNDTDFLMELHDICLELDDIGISAKIEYFDKLRITIRKTNDSSQWLQAFKISDCREIILRMIDYLSNEFKLEKITADPLSYDRSGTDVLLFSCNLVDITKTFKNKFYKFFSRHNNNTQEIKIVFVKKY